MTKDLFDCSIVQKLLSGLLDLRTKAYIGKDTQFKPPRNRCFASLSISSKAAWKKGLWVIISSVCFVKASL
jgi:hypothetical protein